MKRFFLALLLITAGLQSRSQTTLVDSIQSDGVWRSYRLYVPPGFTANSPLILNLHGLGSNAFEQQYYSNFMPIADTAGFLMAYPQGLSAQGTTYWNAGVPPVPPTDDVKFLSALIDTLQRRYTTDPQRVYATGMSLGGYMSYYLGCHLSEKIAAVASVTGTMYGPVTTTCAPAHPMPVLQIHGTADATVPYGGNATGIGIDSLVSYWVRKNGCTPTPVVTAISDTSTSDNSTAEQFVYSGGLRGSTVEFFKVTNGGHTWPGTFNIGFTTNQDFSASKEIWRFFRPYRLASLQGLAVTDPFHDLKAVSVAPNPCPGILLIDAPVSGAATLRDLSGRTMIRTQSRQLDLSALQPGLYLLDYQSGERHSVLKVIKE